MSNEPSMVAVVMTKNEAHNLEDALRALSSVPTVVVDSGSHDGTPEIARSLGADVMQFEWDGQYPKKKQWCLENIEGDYDYIFFVDADERPTESLLVEVRSMLSRRSPPTALAVRYDYYFLDRRLRFGHQPEKIVVLDRARCLFPVVDDLHVERMWEVEGHYQPIVRGDVELLESRMVHRDADDIYALLERHNRYSDWEAAVERDFLSTEGSSSNRRRWLKVMFSRLPFKGFLAFIDSYLFRFGFMDGRPGLHFALFRGFYYWQIHLKRMAMSNKAGASPR